MHRSDEDPPLDIKSAEDGTTVSSPYNIAKENLEDETFVESTVDAHFENALERVGHGAAVSFPSLLFTKGLSSATTMILTNGFAASLFGLYVLAKRLTSYVRSFVLGFPAGLSRFLPTASPKEQDLLVTVIGLIVMGTGTTFGIGLFIVAPRMAQVFDYGHPFRLFVRILAIGLPVSLWLQTIHEILHGLEDVGARNLLFRFGLPTVQLAVACIGAFLFHDLVVVVWGMVFTTALGGIVLTGWLVRRRGFSPRIRGTADTTLRRRFIRFSLPLAARNVVISTQREGFYLLIVVFLSSIAGGIFAVGSLVGSMIRLPLKLNNQFMSPVVADLYERDQHDALIRLFQVTSRLILVGITGLAIPFLVYRRSVLHLFGPSFAEYASLLPGFILAEFAASAAGSVGIILKMTDHEQAWLLIDTVTALFMVVTAIPLTTMFGLQGLVVSYLLMNVMNNGFEIIVLYYLEGLHPFTSRHVYPLIAAVPFLLIALSMRRVLSAATAPLVGTLVGLATYGAALHMLGFTTAERRLARSLSARYWERIPISR